jgi:hypothetical protein
VVGLYTGGLIFGGLILGGIFMMLTSTVNYLVFVNRTSSCGLKNWENIFHIDIKIKPYIQRKVGQI